MSLWEGEVLLSWEIDKRRMGLIIGSDDIAGSGGVGGSEGVV